MSIELDFPNCYATLEGYNVKTMTVAWKPYAGAASYKVFFSSRTPVVRSPYNVTPDTLSAGYSHDGLLIDEQTDPIIGTSTTYTFSSSNLKQHAYVYAYSDSSATVRLSSFPTKIVSANSYGLYYDHTFYGVDPSGVIIEQNATQAAYDTIQPVLTNKGLTGIDIGVFYTLVDYVFSRGIPFRDSVLNVIGSINSSVGDSPFYAVRTALLENKTIQQAAALGRAEFLTAGGTSEEATAYESKVLLAYETAQAVIAAITSSWTQYVTDAADQGIILNPTPLRGSIRFVDNTVGSFINNDDLSIYIDTKAIMSYVIPSPPTTPVVSVSTVTASSFTANWTGGAGATSYTYTLNGVAATPSTSGVGTATFTGLIPLTNYYLIVTAVNSGVSTSSVAVVITTLSTPAPATPETVTATQATFAAAADPAAATSAIDAALAANLAPETIVAAALAVAITSPTMFTALVSNPAFQGTTVSVPAAVATALYAAIATSTIDASLPLYVNFPAAGGLVSPPRSGSNSKLAIDLTATGFFPFNGCTGYGIRVAGGVQYFVTPTNQIGTLVVVGNQITFTPNGGVPITFTVADLDVVLIPYTPPAPPAVVCFLGSAPVLTPSGYKRIDRLAVGDIVKTPTGTATIEAIKKQVCEPSTHTNPYVIPEGKFGANRKLHISPRHKVSVYGVMIEARDLGLIQEEQPKEFTYYNIQITKSQNMIVAGVEVESLKPLVRVNISREAFNYILTTQHGGILTDEIKAKCHFLPDGRVSVPSIKH